MGDHHEEIQEEQEHMMEEHEEVQEYEDQDTQLMHHFTAQDEHGNTIVLTAEQMQSYQDQLAQQVLEGGGEVEEVHEELVMHSTEDAETQQIVNDILDSEEHHLETQEMMDDEHHVSSEEFRELITLHTVDSEGNLISGIPDEEEEEGQHEMQHEEHEHMDLEHVDDEIQIGHEEEEHIDESMIATGSIEEVVTSTAHEEEDDDHFGLSNASFNETTSSDMTQFLSVQDSVFNPVTGTLQPISSLANTTQTPTPPAPKPRKSTKQQHVKFVLANSSNDGNGQQLMLDAAQLQGLLQGGGNTITLSGPSGKRSILVASSQKGKSKSPLKILPAPVPAGDMLQDGSTSSPAPRRILLKQGNVLTPVSIAPGSTGNLLQVTGSDNKVKYLRVIQNTKPTIAPLNKIPISPMKPKFVQKSGSGQTLVTLPPGTDLSSLKNSGLMMLQNYMIKQEHGTTPIAIRPALDSQQAAAEQAMLTLQQNFAAHQQVGFDSFRSLLEPNGMRPRKPCNCTKSQCLKLYCDCFANGEFCHLCNCNSCFNNLTHEEDRQKAIKLVLERNPVAFRPKIGKSSQTGEPHERRHNKGCNCRRSGCLKNYCECYEAKIFCSGICKCTGCKNCIENIPSGLPNGVGVEQHFAGAGTSHRQTLKDLAEAAEVRVQQQNQVRNKMKAQWQDVSTQNNIGCTVPAVVFRYPEGSVSLDVVTSTVDLLLAKGEAAERQHLNEEEQERILIEEFGECLAALMEVATTPGQE